MKNKLLLAATVSILSMSFSTLSFAEDEKHEQGAPKGEMGEGREHHEGMGGEHKGMREGRERHMKEIDTNGDGVISKEEHAAFFSKKFDEADANKDGKVSKDEMKAMHEKMREKREDRREERKERREERQEKKSDKQEESSEGSK